ncbi:aldehyde dehydrogenase family protein [Streptomyces sp. ISL-22]|uniref:aldehyde dehydrogenase family protein n=1 Tax=unclassified Streptomyces TaxID=2593676 RepID=UPI001BE8F9C3|nr:MULTISPECIES: aldehyde dehydrogenase family protein [unclassified Streptomyces]MBT2421768.1 aldehyde dehydrogenase family protein [Streptomyces sp. ISL-24]MBT2436262.1 aldehyde dehydrogenase family protein [Streptomyces sp. ISL-22]
MAGPSTDVVQLDALGPQGRFRARNRMAVHDVAGQEVAGLSLVPSLFVDRTMKSLRRAATPALDDRIGLIGSAAELFSTATLGGQSVEEYEYQVSRVGGIPISVVRATTRAIAARMKKAHYSVEHARPTGAVMRWDDPLTRTGRAVWARRGSVFAVHAAGNHPGPHSLWPEALALGYRVAVRPSRREPFTPHRLVTALRDAGFGNDQVALLPTDHATADTLLRGADLGLVYGGDDVVRKYAADPSILLQGPGRSKILLTEETDWRDHLDTIIDSVSGKGGTGCVNTTAVFVEGDPTPLCEALAERLSSVPSLPPEDPEAVFPVQPLATAKAFEAHLLHKASGTKPWLGGDGVIAELGDGSAVLRPAVHQLDRTDAPQASVELPFPCVWVAPWTREAGIAPLRNSLVLTAITHDAGLVEQLLEEPSISNVYVGDHRTYWMESGMPHDGYLAEFLMRCKSMIRG